jgi:curved DNA-binding protein CbpA
VAEAAYKALARLHHPDVGGDVETMQALNDAIQTFKAFTEVPF